MVVSCDLNGFSTAGFERFFSNFLYMWLMSFSLLLLLPPLLLLLLPLSLLLSSSSQSFFAIIIVIVSPELIHTDAEMRARGTRLIADLIRALPGTYLNEAEREQVCCVRVMLGFSMLPLINCSHF